MSMSQDEDSSPRNPNRLTPSCKPEAPVQKVPTKPPPRPLCASTLKASEFVQSLPTCNDSFKYREFSLDQLEKVSSQNLDQLRVVHDLMLEKTRSELEKKDEQLLKATNRISDLEKQLSHLKLEMEDSDKKHQDQLSRANEREFVARDEGREEGVRIFRQKLFLTSSGQEFLESLHTGIVEAYKLSRRYIVDMGPHIGHYMKVSFNSARTQAKALGFEGKLNIRDSLTDMPLPSCFKGGVSLPLDHPYWLPVMREAVQKLASADDFHSSLPVSSKIIYDVLPSISDTATLIPMDDEDHTNLSLILEDARIAFIHELFN